MKSEFNPQVQIEREPGAACIVSVARLSSSRYVTHRQPRHKSDRDIALVSVYLRKLIAPTSGTRALLPFKDEAYNRSDHGVIHNDYNLILFCYKEYPKTFLDTLSFSRSFETTCN